MCSETRDECWHYSMAWWENPYFGIEQMTVITHQCRDFPTELC